MSKPPSIRRSLIVGISLLGSCLLLLAAIIYLMLLSNVGTPVAYFGLGFLFFTAFVGCIVAFADWKMQVEQFRRDKGLCVRCGYDLRATPDRCPECGRLVRNRQSL